MSMLYSGMRRSGPLRGRIPLAYQRKLARRYWNRRAPPSTTNIFKGLVDRYQTYFRRPAPTVATLPKGPVPVLQPQPLLQPHGDDGVYHMPNPNDWPSVEPGGGIGAAPVPNYPQMAGALNYATNFKQEWVDDRTWNVRKLPDILAMGILTPQQIEAAGISNVLTMFDFVGGSETDRLELGYLLQRFILEGYIRGVDVPKMMKDWENDNIEWEHASTDAGVKHRKLVLGFGTEQEINGPTGLYTPGGAAGLNLQDRYVMFVDKYWQDSPEVERFGMFFHEFGHQLGMPHAGDGGWQPTGGYSFMGSSPGTEPLPNHPHFDVNAYMPWWNKHSQDMISEIFADAQRGNQTKNLGFLSPNGQPIPDKPPAGYPQVGGTTGGPPGSDITTNIYNINPTVVTPPQNADPTGLIGGGSGPSPESPESMSKTPVAGMLTAMPQLQSFAAGLADMTSRGGVTLQTLAGAIMKRQMGGK